MYDLIIIGGSAAGCSAAIYAARRNLNFLLILAGWGGEVAVAGEVGNYLGFEKISGFQLAQIFKKQVLDNKVNVIENARVESIKILPDKTFETIAKISGGEKKWQSKTVILATGSQPRKLNVSGENELRGKGVSYCSTCDGPLFRNKKVVVIGGGNAGMESALALKEICSQVTILEALDSLRGETIYIEKIKQAKNVAVKTGVKINKIIGAQKVEGVEIENNKRTETIVADGVFIHIGSQPNSQMAPPEINKDQSGGIIIDKLCQTNIAGFFAAGDVSDLPFKQVSIAVGHGAIALLSAARYLENNN